MITKFMTAVVAAIALSGCAMSSGPTYHTLDPYPTFNKVAQGGVEMMVVGQPFPGRQPGVEAALVEGFARNFPGLPKPQFVPAADSANHRVVVVFNAPGRPLPQTICASVAQAAAGITPTAGDKIYASAVYCGGREPMSSAWITLPTPGGPDAGEFRTAMETLIREAIPRDPDPNWKRIETP